MAVSRRAVYQREFWLDENTKYTRPHFRMQKVARAVDHMSSKRRCKLLDVGCGPATLEKLLGPHIDYYGIDIALQVVASNLKECDILRERISSDEAPFDFVVAQGLFEYLADQQSQKFAEIADLLMPEGKFIVSYVNFDRRQPNYYWLYNNIQPTATFRESLAEHFVIERQLPTAHNWNHSEPNRWYVRRPNLHINVTVPILTRWLGVEYLYICRRRLHLSPTSTAQPES